ncbi:WYL domain-containing protein [Brachybacterium hainanense]|uniref:WYL domain-containing protein n=1 Tax=Brachybacterium hainanense TaxID=1541174 RepID=A0ABV6REK0_9MICO
MASRNVERLLNVIMTIGSRPRRGIDRATLFAAIPEYADAATDEAAEKMFERDKAAIRELGLPLRTERYDAWDENAVRYRLDADTSGADLHLSEGEYTVLLAASRAWDDAAAGGAARRVRAKLLSQGLDADADLLRRTPRGSVESLPVLGPLLEAVTSANRVSFAYRTADGRAATRRLEPWVVAVHEGHWYVQGYDLDRAGERVFKASRIESYPQIGAPSTHPREPASSLARSLAGVRADDDTARAHLRVEPFKALALRDAAGAPPAAEEVVLPSMPRSAALRQVRAEARWITLEEPGTWREALADVYEEIGARHRRSPDLAQIDEAPVRRAPRIRRPTSGADHLSRLVSLASYVLARGEVEIAELLAEFGISRKELVADLQVLFVCGDFATGWEQDLIEAEWDDRFVRVRNAEALRRPLSLTASEASALLAGLAALEPVAGEEAQLLASAREKLRARVGTAGADAALGSETVPAVEQPGPGERRGSEDAGGRSPGGRSRADAILDALTAAIREERSVVIRYSPPERAGTSVRPVRPLRVESDAGRAYLRADCALAQDVRLFRLDRIVEILPPGTSPIRDSTSTSGPDFPAGSATEPSTSASGWDSGAALGGDRGASRDTGAPPDSGRLEEDVWLHLDAPALWIAEAFSAGELREAASGGTLALLSRPVRGALVSAVMEAAGAAEVLAPASLRDLIVTRAEEAGARHRTAEPLG